MTTPTTTTPTQPVDTKGLKGGSLGLVSSVVVGIASTAPAYSLAASLGFIVIGGTLVAGVHAPGIILLAFVPMYLIAVAYQELNKAEPDCGTTFTWASRAFGPITGWMGGWGIIVADVIVMANLASIAGSYSFTFVGSFGLPAVAALSSNVFWSTAAGIAWIVVMTYICYRGIEISARLQYFLLAFEVIILIFFAVFALVRVYSGNAESYSLMPSLDWLNPFTLGPGTIAPAMLTAIFIYWGWDTAVSINEETKDPEKTPGRAAIISTVLLLVTYVLVAVATIAFAGVGDQGIGLANEDNALDVFSSVGPALFGGGAVGSILMALLGFSILTSASASTQTTILPTARTSLSMAVYKALPEQFARIHPKYLTPTWSTIGMGIVSVAFYLIFTLISVDLLSALIGSIGLMIAFYYGLTGFACVWYYRRTLFTSPRNFIMRGLFPLLGGLSLLGVFVYGVYAFAAPDWLTDADGKNITIIGIGAQAVVGIGGLLVGVVLMLLWRWRRPEFFRGETLVKRSDYVLAPGEGVVANFGLPDSGYFPTVVASDLSNLPTGAIAIDTETGKRVRGTRRTGVAPASPNVPTSPSDPSDSNERP
ncbi:MULTISPECIES: APC family permease [unclassified Frondihabitans]|uniref:APC family permease n=1 Tax=unclassified Frondihabitans TaxID=2626248 RepID=UPI000F4E2FB7|nr:MULTISPECIES: APC family permease [unclassified Frondihabitans]RPE78040.1 amino acid/polyamine/organocation transporter (APC superfamily) [Frondihabitans sp. PhB153]RPF08320.1 amino acid/polyamine/organocation transporter (APC superfamily) [Frondihabitans sp. PhB161]